MRRGGQFASGCRWRWICANLSAVLRRARFVVAADTGPLHLAAAMGAPVVGLYGPTDPARNGPYPENVVVTNARSADISYKRGSGYSPAMLSITVEQVMAASGSAWEETNVGGYTLSYALARAAGIPWPLYFFCWRGPRYFRHLRSDCGRCRAAIRGAAAGIFISTRVWRLQRSVRTYAQPALFRQRAAGRRPADGRAFLAGRLLVRLIFWRFIRA